MFDECMRLVQFISGFQVGVLIDFCGKCCFQLMIDKIDHVLVSKKYGVLLVGLYGVDGIGKATLCETLCNVYFTKMQGRVFHV